MCGWNWNWKKKLPSLVLSCLVVADVMDRDHGCLRRTQVIAAGFSLSPWFVASTNQAVCSADPDRL
jgi:hypothetical protein